MTAITQHHLESARVAVICVGAPLHRLPAHIPPGPAESPDAVLVVASDGAPHPELWADAAAPVLVVLPPSAGAAAVLAAFAAGADACVRTASTGEIAAHLGALLRRAGQARQ
jgi:hypothetical protein